MFKRPWIQTENKLVSVNNSSPVVIILFFHRPTSKQLVEALEVAQRFSTSQWIRAQEKPVDNYSYFCKLSDMSSNNLWKLVSAEVNDWIFSTE